MSVVQLKVAEAKLNPLITATLEDELTADISRVRLGIERRRDSTRLAARTRYSPPTTCTHSTLVTSSPVREAKYCDDRVCLSVCLSTSISPELHVRSLPDFVTLVTYDRGSSGGVAIRYVLLVLRMTSSTGT